MPLKKKANEIHGHLTFITKDASDIRWAMSTHVQRKDIDPETVNGVIIVGNTDDPDEVWISRHPKTGPRPMRFDDVMELVRMRDKLETYRGYVIVHDPKPVPTTGWDYDFYHVDHDGDPASGDKRYGAAATVADAKAAIDLIEA